MGKSIYLPHEPDDLSLIPRAHNRRREWTTTLSLMPGDMQDVHLNLQQESDGGVESAQPLNLHAFGGQSGSAASCRLGDISRSFESHGGDKCDTSGQPVSTHFSLCPSGDDLALYHRLLCHADCAMCWKQHLW